MAHPTIKLDTSAQAIKRGPPEGGEEGLEIVDDQGNPGLDEGDNEHVPPFLRQSVLGWSLLIGFGSGWLTSLCCRYPPEVRGSRMDTEDAVCGGDDGE